MKTTSEIAQAAWDEITAIQMVHSVCEWDDECLAIITKAIEAATVQGEPVARVVDEPGPGCGSAAQWLVVPPVRGTLLYTSPPKRQPLTPAKARELWEKHRGIMDESEIAYMAFMGTFRHFEAAINGGGA